jgi:hypothetical protein
MGKTKTKKKKKKTIVVRGWWGKKRREKKIIIIRSRCTWVVGKKKKGDIQRVERKSEEKNEKG